MLDELRQAARRQRAERALRQALRISRRLLTEEGGLDGLPLARELAGALEALPEAELDGYFGYLTDELQPDPATVLRRAQAYAKDPADAEALIALQRAAEPPRQELFRRVNRAPGGTAALLRLRRALLQRLPRRPALRVIESDLLHLLSSWFNPGFLQLRRVDWNAPARLLEQVIAHEAVHEIDGWDDLRRRLQPDRRCFAFFHPQLPEAPLIFVEVALLTAMPDRIAPLIDKQAEPQPAERARVAAFYGISNCEPGLRSVSLGNFLIKRVAGLLQDELPSLRTFCTLSPIPGFGSWLLKCADPAALPGLGRRGAERVRAAHTLLRAASDGDLRLLQTTAGHARLDTAGHEALQTLAAAYLVHAAAADDGDPVARFHLDNGARLERLNAQGNTGAKGLRQSFGVMVNYLYDLDHIEDHHRRFRRGEVAHSRAVSALL